VSTVFSENQEVESNRTLLEFFATNL